MTFTEWIEAARFHLMNADGTENSVFLHRVAIVDTRRPLPGNSPAAIGVRGNRDLTILFCYPLVEHLPPEAAAELLKHEILHYIFGHISERSTELRKKYGDATVLKAMDLVVNQLCDEALLAKYGLPGITIQLYNFPENLTTEQYCQLLSKGDPQGGNGQKQKLLAQLTEAFEAAAGGEGDLDALIEEAEKGEGKAEGKPAGHGVMTETFMDGQLDEELRDEAIVRAIEQSRKEAEETGTKKGRGWDADEALEFIKRIKRPAAVHWQCYIRKMASCHMNVRRVSSRRRPSRRHPAYFGRVKRMGSDMWLGVDTSGSMGKEELQLVDSEARALSQQDVLITVIHVDAGVAKMEQYDSHKGLVEFAGRGGTDFSPLFFELDKLPRVARPAFLVYFTDGFGCCSRYLEEKGVSYDGKPRPKECPAGVETLWLIPEGCTKKEDFLKIVPFGAVIIVPRAIEEIGARFRS
jgi:predicted metal-dependent peptidase